MPCEPEGLSLTPETYIKVTNEQTKKFFPSSQGTGEQVEDLTLLCYYFNFICIGVLSACM